MKLGTRLALVSALLALPLWLVLGKHHASAVLYGIVWLSLLSTLSWLLNAHFNRLYRLRYLQGRPEVALAEFPLWRLLLPPEQYYHLRGGMLVQAGLEAEVESLCESGKLPERLRRDLQFSLAKRREDWSKALRQLELGYEECQSEDQRALNRAERARLLVEFFPERLEEAIELLDASHQHFPSQSTMQAIFCGLEGQVMVAAGAPEEALDKLTSTIKALGKACPRRPSLYPWLVEMIRWRGLAHWAVGDEEGARSDLARARMTAHLPKLHERIDRDLARLKAHEPLLPEPPREAVATVRARLEALQAGP